MARYSSRRRRRRRRLYTILAIVIAVVVIAFIYISNPFKEEEISETSPDVGIGGESAAVLLKPVPEPNLSEIPEPSVEFNSQAQELIDESVVLINSKPTKVIEARDRLNEVLPMSMSGQQQRFVKEQLSALSDKWLFSKVVFPQDKLCSSYKVRSGDLLSTIGKRHYVPYEILMEINKISRPEFLKAGETIKVVNGPFHARIYRSSFTLDLYLQNTFVRSFPVGLGQPGQETPTGLWLVKPDGKLISPTWTDPDSGKTYEANDPDYPLGSRWIGLKGLKGEAEGRTGFAIHGTKEPKEIGKANSRGCIRLHNGDAILIYNLFMPGFSQVEVVD